MLYNSSEFACKKGIEAFNLLEFSLSTLPPFYPSFFNPPPQKLFIYDIIQIAKENK